MPEPVHLYASLPHYADHLRPIFDALPAEVRGRVHAPPPARRYARLADWQGVPPGVVLVASWADAQRFPRSRVVYVEHGAGQHYEGTTIGGYAGAAGLDHVVLFVAPNDTVAARWGAVYRAPVAVVGCPHLDPWHRGDRGHGAGLPSGAGVPLTVAVTFHWDCSVCPETRSAWSYYRPHLPALVAAVAARGGRTVGSAHPRILGRLRGGWRRLGVEVWDDPARILDDADVLVADNTSLMYEFASLDRPVVALNLPSYRRDVEHGLRFWSHVPGTQADDGDAMVEHVEWAMTWPHHTTEVRRRATAAAYAHVDGRASERAAAAIMEVL